MRMWVAASRPSYSWSSGNRQASRGRPRLYWVRTVNSFLEQELPWPEGGADCLLCPLLHTRIRHPVLPPSRCGHLFTNSGLETASLKGHGSLRGQNAATWCGLSSQAREGQGPRIESSDVFIPETQCWAAHSTHSGHSFISSPSCSCHPTP